MMGIASGDVILDVRRGNPIHGRRLDSLDKLVSGSGVPRVAPARGGFVTEWSDTGARLLTGRSLPDFSLHVRRSLIFQFALPT